MSKGPAVFRSDQGFGYVSGACPVWLAERNVLPSWSRKGKPRENGAQESFFWYFKEHLGDVRRFATPEELAGALHAGIRYHNERRIHSALGVPPAAFRARWEEAVAAGRPTTGLVRFRKTRGS